MDGSVRLEEENLPKQFFPEMEVVGIKRIEKSVHKSCC
jgi:hypothetical protein